MSKGYWVGCYRSINNNEALSNYAKLAGPAIIKNGGRFLARGGKVETFEHGLNERTVLIEFESVAAAVSAYNSEQYQEALQALADGAERDIRIVEGV